MCASMYYLDDITDGCEEDNDGEDKVPANVLRNEKKKNVSIRTECFDEQKQVVFLCLCLCHLLLIG